MFHKCKHLLESIRPKNGFDTFLTSLHSEAYIGTPNVDVARSDFQRAMAQRTNV